MGSWVKKLGLVGMGGVVSVAWGNSLELHVSMSPVGSFVAKSTAMKTEGSVERSGNGFKLKQVAVDAGSFKTGVELRDTHMKDKYLESGKFPKAVLLDAEGKDGKFTGQLEVKKTVTRIHGTYEITGDILKAKFQTKVSDYPIGRVSYMGAGVEDEVEVRAELTLPASAKKAK